MRGGHACASPSLLQLRVRYCVRVVSFLITSVLGVLCAQQPEERVENENFLEEEPDPMEVEADVDSMLDSLFEMDEQEDADLDDMDEY